MRKPNKKWTIGTFPQKSLAKQWPRMSSRLSLTTTTGLCLRSTQTVRYLSEWIAMLSTLTYLKLSVALTFVQTHTNYFSNQILAKTRAYLCYETEDTSIKVSSSLVHLSLAELLGFSSHFRLIFSFPKEQNILFPDLPEGSVFATSNRTYKPLRPLQKPIILSTGFLTATRGESLYTDSRALLLLESVHDFSKLLLHFISLKNS